MKLLSLLIATTMTLSAPLIAQAANGQLCGTRRALGTPPLTERMEPIEVDSSTSSLIFQLLRRIYDPSDLASARGELKNTLHFLGLKVSQEHFFSNVEKYNTGLPENQKIKIETRAEGAPAPGVDNANYTHYIVSFQFPALDSQFKPILDINRKPVMLSGRMRLRWYQTVGQKLNRKTGKYKVERSAITNGRGFLEFKFETLVKVPGENDKVEEQTITMKGRSLVEDAFLADLIDFDLFKTNPNLFRQSMLDRARRLAKENPQVDSEVLRLQVELTVSIFKTALRENVQISSDTQVIIANARDAMKIVVPHRDATLPPLIVQITVDKDIVLLDPISLKILGYYDPNLRVIEVKKPLPQFGAPAQTAENYPSLPIVLNFVNEVRSLHDPKFSQDHGKLNNRRILSPPQ